MAPRKQHPEGSLRLHRKFRARTLKNARNLVVWLPPGYGRSRSRHPVVYFQDGQNIFDPRTAFLGNAWHAGATAAALIRAGEIIAPIMVGIFNAGGDRMHEYAPTRAEFAGWDGGRPAKSKGLARRYARFVVDEVKPFIDARYRTRPDAANTAIVGSSMGGLAALYLALWHPRTFGHVGALSPSVWWDRRVVVRDFSKRRKKPSVRLWLDMGTAEPGWASVRPLRAALVKRGWAPGVDLHYDEVEGAEHSEAAWSQRVGPLLKFLFGQEKPTAPAKPVLAKKYPRKSSVKRPAFRGTTDVDIW